MGRVNLAFVRNVVGTRIQQNPTPKIPTLAYRGQTTKPPSLTTMASHTATRPNPVYTGDKMLGVAVMHKSNPVPVFSREEAVSVARMRRG